jgi:hypothetical protein
MQGRWELKYLSLLLPRSLSLRFGKGITSKDRSSSSSRSNNTQQQWGNFLQCCSTGIHWQSKVIKLHDHVCQLFVSITTDAFVVTWKSWRFWVPTPPDHQPSAPLSPIAGSIESLQRWKKTLWDHDQDSGRSQEDGPREILLVLDILLLLYWSE